MSRFWGPAIFLVLFLPPSGAFCANKPPLEPPSAAVEAARYERCLTLAETRPLSARYFAKSWEKAGGGHPAQHCAAVALFGLGKYKEAARRLDALAHEMANDPPSLRGHVLDQGGEAWLMAGDPGRAYADLGAALVQLPDDPEILVDRAQAQAMNGNFAGAIDDLDRALGRDPKRVAALVYRASAYRALGRLGPALADADKAVALAPHFVPALLERGDLRRLQGDIKGARADWLEILKLQPKSAAALAAAANLRGLDKNEKAPAAAGTRR
jgi:tetratricopeptide (TPR) repeat protein